MLLGDISRHGKGEEYTKWKKQYSKRSCIRHPLKTEGIIEKHHNNMKNAFIGKKNDRLDTLMCGKFV